MTIAVQILLTLVNSLVPGATTTIITKIVDALVTLVPIIIKEAQDLTPIIRNIITLLRGNGEVTTEQLDQLDAMEAQLDAAFDASDAKAQAEDAAAGD